MKFPNFDHFSDQNKIIFLFNNVDNYICKKLGYFVYEALQIRRYVNKEIGYDIRSFSLFFFFIFFSFMLYVYVIGNNTL